ncbi:MAG: DUF4388 domain-containing protein [Deltaproteobacteria bacterium]|nr:MAG: DUF4388 domain-containing protein [Deltaproteobacteria bacterium]
MSLVGSLEDLGLGDILQIVSLSHKSGVLTLRCDGGEGRIFFESGRVRGACLKGGSEDLRAVLVSNGAISEADFETSRSTARAEGGELRAVLLRETDLTEARLEELLRTNLESAVAHMFQWDTGDFSFEILPNASAEGADLFVSDPVSAQFLAMEGSRLLDEGGGETGGPVDELRSQLEALDAMAATTLEAPDRGVEVLADAAIARADAEAGAEVTAVVISETPTESDAVPVSVSEPPSEVRASEPPVIVVDSELSALEWMKKALRPHFSRVHIFQRTELATNRVRQYLARAEVPLLLLSADVTEDRVTGARGVGEIAARLKANSPRLRILLLTADGAEPPLSQDTAGAVAGCVKRPTPKELRKAAAESPFGQAVRDASGRVEPDAASQISD